MVIGILFEKAIGSFCLILYITGQPCELFAKFFRPSVFHSTAKPPSSVSPTANCRRASRARRRNPSRTWGVLIILFHSTSSVVLFGTESEFSFMEVFSPFEDTSDITATVCNKMRQVDE